MNAIPAFITSLSVLHNNRLIELSVQCVNEVFWGATLEQCRLLQRFSASLPVFFTLHAFEPIDCEDENLPMPGVF